MYFKYKILIKFFLWTGKFFKRFETCIWLSVSWKLSVSCNSTEQQVDGEGGAQFKTRCYLLCGVLKKRSLETRKLLNKEAVDIFSITWYSKCYSCIKLRVRGGRKQFQKPALWVVLILYLVQIFAVSFRIKLSSLCTGLWSSLKLWSSVYGKPDNNILAHTDGGSANNRAL